MILIKELWPFLIAAVGFVAWIIRLEARANGNSRELSRLEKRLAQQRAEDLANRQRDWDQVNARLEGIGTDIKELLQRTSH